MVLWDSGSYRGSQPTLAVYSRLLPHIVTLYGIYFGGVSQRPTGSHFQTQMSAKQSKIEKLKLEIRKLEAERDGLKQVQNYAENG